MNERERENLKLEGIELLRRGLEVGGFKIGEERYRGDKLLLRCSSGGHSILASLLLDSAGWELTIISNNGIAQKNTLSSRGTAISDLRGLMERAGISFLLETAPVQRLPEGNTVSEMLINALDKKESVVGKGVTVKQLLRKFGYGG